MRINQICTYSAFRYKNTYAAIQKEGRKVMEYCLMAAIPVRQYKRDAEMLMCIA